MRIKTGENQIALYVGGRRARCRLVLRRGLRLLRCWLLLELLLLFFLCHVMAYRAAGGGTQDGMMAGHVTRNGADCGALETAFSVGAFSADQE